MKNWKTTLAGLAAGVVILWQQGISLKSAALAVAVQFLGAVAKDSNVTGGTKKQ